jgi:hypothetical protein
VAIRNWPEAERQTAEQHGPSRRARSDLGQGGDAWSAQAGLAHDQVAGRLGRLAVLALCTCARGRRAQRVGPEEAVARVAADRPEGEGEPTKYWLSTLPANISFRRLVDLAKLRWRIERDYQELKQEVGLGHYERRGWRGFHHHATLCIAAYGFLIAERATIPPQDLVPPRRSRRLSYPRVIDPEDPPSRPERHIPNSIATMRLRLIRALVKTLPRCPCCGVFAGTYKRRKLVTQ